MNFAETVIRLDERSGRFVPFLVSNEKCQSTRPIAKNTLFRYPLAPVRWRIKCEKNNMIDRTYGVSWDFVASQPRGDDVPLSHVSH
jgi:hypothetical protein